MNADMVELWNKTVGPKDHVFHLGDFVINRKYLSIAEQLNGIKTLIKGNHDNFKLEEYAKYFKDIKGSHVLAGFLCTHIPVHPNQFHRWPGNIHGHLHTNHVMREVEVETGVGMMNGLERDPRYMNVCVEQTEYRPISLETVVCIYRKRGIKGGINY